jgi:hypothetical protein
MIYPANWTTKTGNKVTVSQIEKGHYHFNVIIYPEVKEEEAEILSFEFAEKGTHKPSADTLRPEEHEAYEEWRALSQTI